MDRDMIRAGAQALLLLIPVNIYVIGDWLGTGIQWAFVRYQQTYMGTSIIPVTRDLSFVLTGTMSGRSGAALIAWGAGTALLVAALGLVLYTLYVADSYCPIRYAPELTVLAGILFLASCMMQYGITLSGASGLSIPVGVPLIIITGYWTYLMDRDEPPACDDEALSGED